MTVATFQPIFTQAFPRHDRYTGLVAASDYTVQRYILEWQAFAPTTHRDALGYDIALPLTEVPVFKFTHVDLAIKAYDFAKGVERLPPMCSMMHSFMPGIKWIWPSPRPIVDVGFQLRRPRSRWGTYGDVFGLRPRSMEVDYAVVEVGHEEISYDSD